MKQLTCEMCGSTDLVKQDGFFVCQTCGTKYSVEEAKKMIIEGTVNVKGSVKIDETDKVASYYEMAEAAYEAGNKLEAEVYCNKVIEIDPGYYKAWFLKGKTAGWLSTIGNQRIEESVNCFSKAIDKAPEDKKEKIKEESAEEISSLSVALMELCCENFAKSPSQNNEKDILDSLNLLKLYSALLLEKCGVVPNEFYKEVANMMNSAVCTAWEEVVTVDYKHSGYPSKRVWETYKDRCFSCINIIKVAIDLSDDDKQSDIQRYKNLILITQELVDSCSYCLNGKGKYTVECTLTNQSKEINIDHIMEYHKKIKEIDPNYEIPKRPMDRFSRRKIIKLIIWLAVGVTVLLFAMISGIAK